MNETPTLLCATGNALKFGLGQQAFAKYGIILEQIDIEVDEIQGEDAEVILRDKAKKAFAIVGKPLVVTDDSWVIPALGGFPGPYMKSMNHWLTPEDFINLMKGKEDRTIYLEQRLAYVDDVGTVTFTKTLGGTVVEEPRGNTGTTAMKIVQLDGDELTVAELYDGDTQERRNLGEDAWSEAAAWYANKVKNG